jgi:hypothetical protein
MPLQHAGRPRLGGNWEKDSESMKTPTSITAEYGSFLIEVKVRIQSARLQAGRAVNRELVLLFWDIGRGIMEKQQTAGWGDAVVKQLAADLRSEFPDMRGFRIIACD